MTDFGDRLRRFLTSWMTLIASFAIAPLALGVGLEVLAFSLPGDWADGRVYAHPLALSIVWALLGAFGGVVFGWVFVLLRRFIVRPDLPFVRAGYLGVAAIPFAFAALAYRGAADWYWMAIYAQAPIAAATLVYVGLANRFGVFDREDPSWWPTRD